MLYKKIQDKTIVTTECRSLTKCTIADDLEYTVIFNRSFRKYKYKFNTNSTFTNDVEKRD